MKRKPIMIALGIIIAITVVVWAESQPAAEPTSSVEYESFSADFMEDAQKVYDNVLAGASDYSAYDQASLHAFTEKYRNEMMEDFRGTDEERELLQSIEDMGGYLTSESEDKFEKERKEAESLLK